MEQIFDGRDSPELAIFGSALLSDTFYPLRARRESTLELVGDEKTKIFLLLSKCCMLYLALLLVFVLVVFPDHYVRECEI